MSDIKIRVEGRKATNLTPEVKLVTWNEGYEAEFEFDDSWKASELKTALFITKGQTIRKPFTGNKCEVPMLVGVEILRVGVESNDILGLKTTVAAIVECELSARDLSGEEVEAPTPSVYDELIELINAGMVKGEQGEKGEKGDKGDAGAIKFMAVTSLPTENIATDAIYLLPMPDGTGDNTFAEYVYIDGKWEVLGSVALNVDHSEYVKFTDFYEQLVKNLTENSQEMTDAEKASACDWLGALPKWKPAADGSATLIGLTAAGTYYAYPVAYGTPRHNAIPCYVARGAGNNVLGTGTPVNDTDCANKKYVDDLVGDIETALNSVIAIQNSLVGGSV